MNLGLVVSPLGGGEMNLLAGEKLLVKYMAE
jgi:hypothetical protein